MNFGRIYFKTILFLTGKEMKKILLMTVILTSLYAAQTHAESTLDRIKTSGKITIGYRDAADPISYTVNDKPVGYALDICNQVVSDIKKTLNKPDLQVKYELVHPMTRIPDVITGKIDLECGTTTNTKQRQDVVDFSTSYFVTEVRMAVKSNTNFAKITDLNGKAIVTTKGTTSDKYIRTLKRNDLIDVKNIFGSDNNEAFALLSSGRASALVMDDNTLAGLIAKSGHPQDYKMIGPVLSKEPYGIMIAKNNPQLKSMVDHVIHKMWISGEMAKLYKKWFQSPIPPNNLNLNIAPNSSFKQFEKAPNDEGIDLS